jgi:hypothetical protein
MSNGDAFLVTGALFSAISGQQISVKEQKNAHQHRVGGLQTAMKGCRGGNLREKSVVAVLVVASFAIASVGAKSGFDLIEIA